MRAMIVRRLVVTVAGLALLAVACETEGDIEDLGDEPPTSTSTSTTVVPTTAGPGEPPPLTQTCVDEGTGFSIGYPEGWSTNDLVEHGPCRFFDPAPFDVPETGGFADIAVMLLVEPRPADEVVDELADEEASEVVFSGELEVDGHRARSVEIVVEGDPHLPDGSRIYAVLVDVDDVVLAVRTVDTDAEPPIEHRAVIDAMVDSLRFVEPPQERE